MKRLWLGEDLGDLSTIEDGASVEEIRDAIGKMKKSETASPANGLSPETQVKGSHPKNLRFCFWSE